MRILTENPLLKKKCKLVTIDQGRLIARRMVAYLLANNKKNKTNKAIGLAANQFGIDAAVAVVLIKQKPLILINPKIEKFSEIKFLHKEGCLSFPNEVLDVYRHFWIEVESDNFNNTLFFGNHVDQNSLADMLESAVVQHEIAHLNGLTFHDFQWTTSLNPSEW